MNQRYSKINQFRIYLIGCLFIFCQNTLMVAQEMVFILDANVHPTVTVTGKSTLHDWEVKCPDVAEYPERVTVNLDGGSIESFGFTVAVSTMDGGRGAAMNKKIYEALKMENHPEIQFEQTSPAEYGSLTQGGSSSILVAGNVNIAGMEMQIEVPGTISLQGGNLIFTGSKALKLSEFSIDPPSAMFGQIQTRDDIVVHFTFQYAKLKP